MVHEDITFAIVPFAEIDNFLDYRSRAFTYQAKQATLDFSINANRPIQT